jgi:hypothetical protein
MGKTVELRTQDHTIKPRRPLDYIIVVLPGVVIPPCLATLIFKIAPWYWFLYLSDFLRPTKFDYGEITKDMVLRNWFILLVPILAGLFFCRLWGRWAGVIAGAVLAFLSFGCFYIQMLLAGG